jgi:hypothetical protein
MRKPFASFLLAGKTASLPFLAGPSYAQITNIPSADLLSSDVHIIEEPGIGVQLLSTTIAAPAPDGYGGGTAAQICLANQPTVLRVVVTGVRQGETVFLVSSKDKDAAAFRQFHPDLRIGATDLLILTHFTLKMNLVQSEQGAVSGNSESVISIPVDLAVLSQHGYLTLPKFYLQAGAYSISEPFTHARVSELDEVGVISGTCYGGTYP